MTTSAAACQAIATVGANDYDRTLGFDSALIDWRP